ncbi:MAG: metal transporter [Flavobacterium sp. BFFFF1]|uniref:heavy-metal-associated domain-containing protein n=1 Tax=unclassified Flavobacterium TaxID=196869 RepID=UPI000BD4550D|nr:MULTISPECIES: cation transporter [unclassified Flavobacterium]OYU80421.1 MAG: metal transporter [Flavobacterium sp. BFFFF1]
MKNIVLIIAFMIGFSANAQENKNKNAKYTIEVNGNCEQCKKRIEKAAFGVAGVKSAVWNVESHKLSLILNEEKTSIAAVETAVAKVGHDTETQKSTDEAYEKLHSCCKYDRK